jgi:hypothetical protein
MEEQKTPKINVLGQIVRSKWYWITFLAIPLLAATILTAMPYGIDYAAEQWLLSHGLDVASVEDVDFNPFTGKLVLRDVKTTIADAQVLHVPEATLILHCRPFFTKTAHIEKLSIRIPLYLSIMMTKGTGALAVWPWWRRKRLLSSQRNQLGDSV